MTAPDSGLRFTWRLTSTQAHWLLQLPEKLCPLPQNRVLHNGLQGITFDELTIHNEKLDYCGTEQSSDHFRARDADAGQEGIARPRP